MEAYSAPGDQMPLLTWFPFDISAIQVFPSAGLLGLASNYKAGAVQGEFTSFPFLPIILSKGFRDRHWLQMTISWGQQKALLI